MDQAIFKARRQKLLQQLKPGEMAVLMSSPHAKRNSSVHYPFRNCSYFYYLTGVSEHECAAIFLPGDEKPYRLFVLPKDPIQEMWEGKRIGVDAAKDIFQADATFSIHNFGAEFRQTLKKAEHLYFLVGNYPGQDEFVFNALKDHHPNPRQGDKAFLGLKNLTPILGNMRKIKCQNEAALLRKNGENTGLGHKHAMACTKPGMWEYQIEAEIEYFFRNGGAEDLAYSSIVAGGNNATVLHYKTNRDQLRDGELLLIDAGGEMGLYASDITRTFPVNGKFTPEQKALYEIVLKAQKDAINSVRPGFRFHDVHKVAVDVLIDGLLSLGLMKGNHSEIVADRKNYSNFYPHNTSHWIGLDVHDTGDYFAADGVSMPLEVGNYLTIEPGLYIGKDRTDVPEAFRGIGIRIEDDVLVTANGCDVLTSTAPKEVDEIESIVGKGRHS